MVRSRFAACLALTAALSAPLGGCMVGPDFKTPEPPPTDRYLPEDGSDTLNFVSAGIPEGEAQRVVLDMDIPGQWWTVFQSAPLNALIERSLRANPDIAAAIAGLKISQQTARAQRAALFPTVTTSGQASQTQAPTSLSAPTADNTYVFGLFTLFLNVNYVLDVWGGVRRATESAEAQSEQQCFLLEAAYLTLASNVVVAAITEASLRGQVDVTQRIIAAQRETLNILNRQAGLGAISGADVASQEAQLAQSEATLPPLQKALAQQRNLIATLTGSLTSTTINERFELNDLKLPADLPLSLPSKMIEQPLDGPGLSVDVASAVLQPAHRPGQHRGQRRHHADPARRWRPAGQEACGAGRLRAGPGAIQVGRADRFPQCRRHPASPRARCPGAAGVGRRRASLRDQPRHRAPPARAGRHHLRHRAAGRTHLPAGPAAARPGAGQPPVRHRGPVPGAGRRLVEPRRWHGQPCPAHDLQAAQGTGRRARSNRQCDNENAMIRKALAASLLFAMAASVSACASGCGATPDKLAALRRGMSYAEASGIMGCSGSALKTESDDVRSVEWTGPGTIASVTDLDFQNDRLLYYQTRSKYGL